MAAAAAEAAALAEQLNSAQHRQRDLAAENERRRRDAGLWRNDVQRLQQRAAQLQQELRRSGEALAEQDKREQTERQKLQQLQLEREQARQALASAREALAELEADDGDLLRRLAVATAARDTAQAELERSSRELEERRRQLRQAERLIASLAEERVSLAEQHATAAAAQQDAALEVTALTAQRTQQRLEQSELRKALPQLEQAISALEAERQALYRSHAEANSRYAAADAQRQKAEDDLVGLRERAGGELDIEAGEQGQRTQIRSLSSVNLEATRDYEELSNRLNFLTTQQADLEEASRSLRQAISDLNSTVAERFELTFNQVAEEFRNCFSELFGGGAARLTLTQPDNLHQSGIEIVAQPPGKRWQSLALLSGGERALTAVALLFALLRVKPTPFCVLDEVDAALDDANVARAARMITELSAQTQFVVITHNKGTREEAGALYGITMAHDGISKLVSMRMADVISDTGD